MAINRMPSHLEGSVLGSAVKNIHKQYYGLPCCDHSKNKGTQTDYRENECQTVPWEPPYQIKPGHDPEVLTLLSFIWDHGLPAGRHEVEIINRMRMKRAWKKILPPMDTRANIKNRISLLSALEAEEWAYRDAEIQFIMNLRMDLAEKALQSREIEQKNGVDNRFKRLKDRLNKNKQQEIKRIRNKFTRELQRLSIKHEQYKIQRHKRDIVKTHTDRDSNYYHPKPRHRCSELVQTNFYHKEALVKSVLTHTTELPQWLYSTEIPHYTKPRTSGYSICPKYIKAAETRISQLRKDLASIRTNIESTETCTLLKLRMKMPALPPTPTRSSTFQIGDEVDVSASLLQKLVRGRAIQCEIFEARNRYGELIDELQSDRALRQHSMSLGKQSAAKQQQKELEILQTNRVNEILRALEGKTIAKTLTYLTEELTRLENEKKAHALAMMAERERIKKQIAQLGSEQLEMNRRRELDEMYRQMLKVTQESVDVFLEDIVKDGIEWVSDKEATKYIVDWADKVDAVTKQVEEDMDKIDEEGIVSDMVYNFVLPEVEKESTRKRLREKQRSYLHAAHASIYDEILNIPADELLSDASDSIALESLTLQSGEEEEIDEGESVSGIYVRSFRDEDSFKRIIQLIFTYTGVPDEYQPDVHDILERMLRDAANKTRNLDQDN